MSAKSLGYQQGRDYIRLHPVEQMTFADYREVGRVGAAIAYKRQETQAAYLLGWWHAGEQLRTLFQTEETDTWGAHHQVQLARNKLAAATEPLSALASWRPEDSVLHARLARAQEGLAEALLALGQISEELASPAHE